VDKPGLVDEEGVLIAGHGRVALTEGNPYADSDCRAWIPCPSSYTSRTGWWRPCKISRPLCFQFLKTARVHQIRGRGIHGRLIRQVSASAPFGKGVPRISIRSIDRDV